MPVNVIFTNNGHSRNLECDSFVSTAVNRGTGWNQQTFYRFLWPYLFQFSCASSHPPLKAFTPCLAQERFYRIQHTAIPDG